MEMSQIEDSILNFKVHIKKNLKIKYTYKASKHSKNVLEGILRGILERLNKMMRMTNERQKMTIDELYPVHIQQLKVAKLINKIPMERLN